MRKWKNRSDREFLDRLLAGEVDQPDRSVAAILAAASAPPSERELLAAPELLTTLAHTAASRKTAPRRARPARARSWFARRVVVLGVAGALLLTGALASFGALPDSIQSVAHSMLGKVGIHVPDPDQPGQDRPFERGEPGRTNTDVSGPRSDLKPDLQSSRGPKPERGQGNGRGATRDPKPKHTPSPSPKSGQRNSNGSGNAYGVGR